MATNLIDLTGGQRGSVISAVDPNLSFRRQQLARLLERSLNPPAIQSTGELITRLGTTGLRQFGVERARKEEEQKRQEQLKALVEAISPMTETIPGVPGGPPGEEGFVPDQTRERPKTIQELAQALAGNPLTARTGLGLTVDAAKARQKHELRERKAPKTRRRIQGGTVIQEEFDPVSGEFSEIGRGPRFKPAGAGGITLTQERDNLEIAAARRELAASGLSREEILKRSQKATDTGFDNPEFDPFINRLVRAATQRKTGPDPEFKQFFSRIFGTSPSASNEEISRILKDPTGGAKPGAAGAPSATPSRTPPPTERELRRRNAAKPDIGETVTIKGKSYEVLGYNPDGTLTILDLTTGRQFFANPG